MTTYAVDLATVREWLVKMRHADSLLTTFDDTEFAAGLAALAASSERSLGGALHLVVDDDLVVLLRAARN